MATRMQDQYSAMMGSQQRNDPYKEFTMNRPPATTAMTSPAVSNPSYYHSLNYGLPTYGSPDIYGSMSMAAAQSHDFSPLPAHMGTPNQMNTNNGLSRVNPTSHTISHTASSPGSELHMSDMSSPGPSTSRVSLSPDGHSQGAVSNPSPGELSIKQESSNSDNSSVKSGTNDEDNGMHPKKRSLSTTPEGENRDGCYWEKRKKNNESAKRSREARRMKEEQIALRVVYLEQENLQLRTEVSLLKSEIEKLRCMLYNS